MPNWVTHRFTVLAGDCPFRDQGEALDFNRIVPMPEELKIDEILPYHLEERVVKAASTADPEAAIEAESLQEEERAIAFRLLGNLRRFGYASWYSWSCAHWGTQWNACGTPCERDSESAFHFVTAWATPEPLFQAIATKHSNLIAMVEYADQILGQSVGIYRLDEGNLSHEDLTGTVEGRDLAYELNQVTPFWCARCDDRREAIEDDPWACSVCGGQMA